LIDRTQFDSIVDTLDIDFIAATLMASFQDPPGLRELEYFAYLEKVICWNLFQGKLELDTLDPDDKESILFFSAD
jgi:hypothetical protein